MMKLINRRNEGRLNDLARLIPTVTHDEHLQRVEEWTQKSQPAPPSNKRKSNRQVQNEDFEAKSRLVSEALRLMDNRDEQIRSRPGTAVTAPTLEGTTTADDTSPKNPEDDGDMVSGLGKRFRDSKMTARTYVKEFETKMKKKNDLTAAILNVYPVGKAKKNFRTKMVAQMNNTANFPSMVEPDSWKQKMSRNVRFSIKPPSVSQTIPSSNDKEDSGSGQGFSDKGEVDNSKWMMKHENDRDWWKWKLRQRFMQNDELLQKLASQRQKFESALNLGGMRKKRLSLQSSNASSLTALPLIPKRSSSRHIMLEIAPSKPGPILKRPENNDDLPPRLKDPMPNFYSPSRQFLNKINVPGIKSTSTTAINKHKLKTMRKDPYLAKLLAGNEQFKPEMMLDASQSSRKHELSQQFKDAIGRTNTNNNARRKLSLESLTDSTDDDFTAQKFFNPDVKVLYERMSEMDTTNIKAKSNKLMNLVSREPSDGFLNLPLLLATGRFNRYNKLPYMKGFNDHSTSKQRRSEKSYRNKSQNSANRKRFSSVPPKFGNVGIVQAAAAALASKDEAKGSGYGKKIEEMTTKEWAKQIMLKMKPHNTTASNKTDTDESFVTLSDDDDDDLRAKVDTRLFNVDEIQDSLKDPSKKYKVPTDQETNLLYHEILMSKWKKEKHDKSKDLTVGHGGAGNSKNLKAKWKRGALGKKIEKLNDKLYNNNNKPRGLDIWLENIREKAKRDRLIAPQPITEVSEIPDKITSSQPLVTTFNNAAFDATD